MNKKSFITAATALAAGTVLALAAPLAASAHVTVGPNQAAAGSYPLIDFKVPTESATATTTKLELTLPEDTPFGYVSYVPVAGWTTQLVTSTLAKPIVTDDGSVTEAVTKVIWTAQPGAEITAEQYGIFPLAFGPVPDTGKIKLSVDQTYSDGTVVSWNEDGESAKHPAPVLYVNDAPPASHHDAGASVEVEHGATATASDDVLARVLGIGGLVLGVVGIVVGVTGRRKTAA
ncbi:MAG: YcnI family protein [Rhodoglobus sp.]